MKIIFLAAAAASAVGCTTDSSDKVLPVDRMQSILGFEGHVSHGVLDVSVPCPDIGRADGPRGTVFTPSFQLHGELFFQPLASGSALLNGEMALKTEEVDPFIAALIQHDLVVQACHQHTPSSPQVWHVHFRGISNPVTLAHEVRAALDTTSTPVPEQIAQASMTPLDAARLARTLHGDYQIEDDGVVVVSVNRKTDVTLDGLHVRPEAGISHTIEFRPRSMQSDATADVVSDFSMLARDVNPVVSTMLIGMNWDQGCLHNQETAEQPQLYFDHMIKQGDPYQLAAEVRLGIDLTDSE